MKDLFDWFINLLNKQKTHEGQRAVADLFGLLVLVVGLLLLWLIVAVCDWLGLNS